MYSNDFLTSLQKVHDNHMADVMVSSNVLSAYFNMINHPHRHIQSTKDKIYPINTVIYFSPKSFVLTKPFNKLLRSFREAGLTLHEQRKYERKFKHKQKKQYPRQLEIQNILAALELCGISYFIICIIFALELLSNRLRRAKIVLDYLTY